MRVDNVYVVVKAVTALHSRRLQLRAEILACIMMMMLDNNCKLLCKNKVGCEHVKLNFSAGCRGPTPQDSN